jgi:serine O-acetyltransferase
LLPGIVTRHNLVMYGFDMTQSIPVGPGLYVPHPAGTVITASCIGANVTVVHAVTIGMRQTPEFPEIGSGVFIGAGARVLGGIKIGDNASIGANAVVITDIPANATAVGIPAKVKSKANSE